MIEHRYDEHVAIITLNEGENRFNPEFIKSILEVLDEIENESDAQTLVVQSAHEKIFSNGLDLEWLAPVIQNKEMKIAKEFFYSLDYLYKRTLTYPLITIAAITGHAFAGGAIWTCAFDFRLMRKDRGYLCFPEVDLGIPFLPGMLALMKKAVPNYLLENLFLTGARLTADECEKHHIIEKSCHIDTLLDEAMTFAKSIKKERKVVKELKSRAYKDIVYTFDVEDVPYIESEEFHIS